LQDVDAIIVGAGPAGLACAATMRAADLNVTLLEKADTVGSAWRHHYDRLHLHTDRKHSGLPGMAMPRTYPLYPSRLQVIAYLESYAARFEIKPALGTEVLRLRREGTQWRADTARGPVMAPITVVATGMASVPHRPSWPGMESYRGVLVHTSGYRNPAPFLGKRVLVVGFGNSGGEVALDLAEAGVDVAIAVRGPVQILPRDLMGLPILTWAILYQHLPARLVDLINAPILRLALGPTEKLGLRRATKGPRRMIEEDGRVPLIDFGTLDKIRDGSIGIRGAIARFSGEGVVFDNGSNEAFGAVVLATGFRPNLGPLMADADGVLDQNGMPLATGRPTAAPGLYFCGQIASSTGQLRAIGREAQRIAEFASRYLADTGRAARRQA
jgi:cation diffusion facilitator CzcD-associated flavoprotein CzcO